jgi:proteasome alpha subunit
MSMPFYVPAEQMMKDKADYARKNIARGRPLVAVTYTGGILLCAENAFDTLHKISEIYDRIAFGGVGLFTEFDALRVAGVRAADLKGYSYSRDDVDARSLANNYGQILRNIFTHEMKPMEVEIVVAEVGQHGMPDAIYHVLFDGAVVAEKGFTAVGGEAEAVQERLAAGYDPGADLQTALNTCISALAGPDRTISADELEVAVLDRVGERRAFRRIDGAELEGLVPTAPAPAAE